MEETQPPTLLKELANSIKKVIDEGLTKGVFKSEDELYEKWVVKEFKYDDNGLTSVNSEGQHIVKPSWFRATIKIVDEIKKSAEYNDALSHLTKTFGEKVNDFVLDRFIQKIITDYLYNEKFDTNVDVFIDKLLKSLKGEPLTYGAEVKLDGVILRPDKVDISHGVMLRKPTKEDLEKEYLYGSHAYSQQHGPNQTLTSAILRIEFLGRRSNETQRRVGDAITILRLFRPGSVKFESYRMFSDSITDFMASGSLFSGETTSAQEKYLLTEDDVKPLQRFWENLQPLVEKHLPWPSPVKENHITIAYKRYSDALLQNGLIERQIANAIMGLEGLFLKGGETQELTNKLSNRVAKVLGTLNEDPLEVKRIITDAYRVRSLFVHGGQLDYNARTKLEAKYKNVKNLLSSILNYLRVCLIVYLTLHIEKEAFVDIIDRSFIHKESNESITGFLYTAQQILNKN